MRNAHLHSISIDHPGRIAPRPVPGPAAAGRPRGERRPAPPTAGSVARAHSAKWYRRTRGRDGGPRRAHRNAHRTARRPAAYTVSPRARAVAVRRAAGSGAVHRFFYFFRLSRSTRLVIALALHGLREMAARAAVGLIRPHFLTERFSSPRSREQRLARGVDVKLGITQRGEASVA